MHRSASSRIAQLKQVQIIAVARTCVSGDRALVRVQERDRGLVQGKPGQPADIC